MTHTAPESIDAPDGWDQPRKLRARVLVCGGRDYADYDRVFAVLDRFHAAVGIEAVIHGASGTRDPTSSYLDRGADLLADNWARVRGVPALPFLAAWKTYGNAAGPLRNARMLRDGEPHIVVAFPGGKGTADMVRRAHKAGVRVCEIPL